MRGGGGIAGGRDYAGDGVGGDRGALRLTREEGHATAGELGG